MPRSCPHPGVLFSLRPRSERAKRLVAHPNNAHNVSTLSDGTLALHVGFHLHGKSSTTLATLGRGVHADIFVEGSDISRVQCSFEIDLDTGVVMLYDRSFANSTQVYGEGATPFERERDQRKILVQEDLNTIIGMGGERRNLILFELEWYQDPTQIAKTCKDNSALPYARVENPRLARTVDEAPTNLSSRRQTRPHTAGELKMRYVKGMKLGSGQFGTVYKAIDVDSGKFMAVKILGQPTTISKQENGRQSSYYALKREVETLSEMKHPHIIDYITSQGWNEPHVEIFMGLKEGTLNSLVGRVLNTVVLADSLFPQMLQALDYIAWKGIVHRDVKPENILYVSQPGGQYKFQLGDFGLCNRTVDAESFAGSYLYMAPEMFNGGSQTHKVDVWSLFVTMLWTLDAGGFRQHSNRFKNFTEVHEAVEYIALNVDGVSKIQEMAIVNPGERASAAQMLVKHFNGEGLSTSLYQVPALSTPLYQVPALTSSPSPTIAAARPPTPAPSSLTTWTPQTRSENGWEYIWSRSEP